MNSKQHQFAWRLRFAAAAGLLVIPACGILPVQTAQPDHVFSPPSPADLERIYEVDPVPARAEYPDEQQAGEITFRVSDVGNKAVATSTSSVMPGPKGIPSPDQRSAVRHATWNADESRNPFQLASFDVSETYSGGSLARFIPAEARQEQPVDPAQAALMETVAAGPMADLYPDEYVFDGGDRGAPVHYGAGDRRGFETEDTIVEFADETGRNRVKPSNRVAVYSPRFGSIRTIDGLEAEIEVKGAVGARDAITAGNLKLGQNVAENRHGTGIVGLGSSRRADGVEMALPPSASAGASRPSTNRKVDQSFEGRKYIGLDAFDYANAAIVTEKRQNAVVWTRDLFPQITANTTSNSEVRSVFKVQETIGVEDQRRIKGDIRIIKLADRDTALAGDVVTFTIQFENPGDFDVYDVRIVDNLTPRLEYIPESGSIDNDNPGQLSVTSNGEGSHILTFTLDGPLKAHSRGVITFETKVR
ncbi:MAG: isopeptide-forming domain-containing fimbrial protein [Planctomycetaceae bacterium]|nr:isopeptide-forming domain-containing fimbrial protein [Planctomycetaceae bacterium]